MATKTTRKGRLPKAVSEKRKRDGKRMFINGLSHTEIAEIFEVHIDTVKNWAKLDEWEEARKMHAVSIGEMKAEVLNTFHALKSGEKPKVSADAIRKLVVAFQDLNDKRKNAAYAIENFNLLTDALINKAMEATSKKDKNSRLEIVKYASAVMQDVANELYQDSLKND
ncbi:hypothetical protein PL373_07975 [Tenacibaculum maritimum]|nr:hypothetical protein [Tenacibaculum maritimum]MDB0601083.1 hypothetical protein [Tenacibaculum maritimum]MDB0612164.1 hypothetical protein [Tenacibaculum maritimum]